MSIYPPDSAPKLGLDIVVNRLKDHLSGEQSLAFIETSLELGSLAEVRIELEAVSELQRCLRFDDPFHFSDFPDVRGALRRVLPQGTALEPMELRTIARVLELAYRTEEYFSAKSGKYPLTSALVDGMTPQDSPATTIMSAIDESGLILDSASPQLRDIRRQLISSRARVREAAVSALARASSLGYAADDQPTIRAGRIVIPVRVEAKKQVSGFIHDVSATGQTVFIEPAAALEGNNRVRELEIEEKQELFAIRVRMSDSIRHILPVLNDLNDRLVKLDVQMAKARLGNELDALVPEVGSGGVISFVEGRNPALMLVFQRDDASREVVPFSMELGRENVLLVISGPNAGGKSVTMKSIGLMATMISMGMPIPVGEKSRFDLFSNVLVDIGDEQSISDDLSTFTSHLNTLRYFLENADQNSLVLIDEAGTGTDPEAGGALAQAILEQFIAKEVRTIVTTHYGPLKIFAHHCERALNGSMLFDQEELKPTFEFMAGTPGSSYATEIATRVGLAENVITRAQQLLHGSKASPEMLIADLMRRNNALADSLKDTELIRSELTAQRDAIDRKIDIMQEERQAIREGALEKADEILRDANKAVEQTIREIKESGADRMKTLEARKNLERTRQKLDAESRRAVQKKIARKKKKDDPANAKEPIALGDRVRMDDGQAVGDVIELDSTRALVAFGSMQLRTTLKRLVRIGGKSKQKVSVKQSYSTDGGLHVHPVKLRLDIRGKRADEALSEIVPFLDRANAAGLERVEILHGKGTGALRQVLQEYLDTLDGIARYDEAPIEEGGAGVTLVFFS